MATRKTEENLSLQDKFRAWWETDTAKAVATIIAVLLIPASVIAWNYATTQGNDIRNQLNTDSTSANLSDENNDQNAMNSDTNSDEMSQDMNEPGQEPATANSSNTNNGKPAVGGIGSVQKFPNTDSAEKYTVVEGDNIYRISLKVCGDESFYKSNLRADRLKVGETLEVHCN